MKKGLSTFCSKDQPSLVLLMIVMLVLILNSCIQSPSKSRRSLITGSSTSPTNVPSKLPDFTQGNNFIQNGGMVYTSSVDFDLSFTDVLQLRGKDVDSYLRTNGIDTISCLTANFVENGINQIHIFAAIPHSLYNFTSSSTEYYYTIAPSDEASNKNFCQKSVLVNKLFSLYPSYAQQFKISNLCPSGTCLATTFGSQPLALYSQMGINLNQVATAQLSFNIKNLPIAKTPLGNSCTTAIECKNQGYDCCSLGQCVKDLALKPDVVQTSPDFNQALQDILNNPSHIYNYPQYYFICSSQVNQPTDTSNQIPVKNQAQLRLEMLTDLYNCTNKLEGEMGICSKTISTPELGKSYSAGPDDRSFATTYTNQAMGSYTPTDPDELNTIQEIVYGEVTLFNYDQISDESVLSADPADLSSYIKINGQRNDNEDSGAGVILKNYPASAINKDLIIRYRVDASCVQLNQYLGKCEKHYVQGKQRSGDTQASARRGRATDHYPASNLFKLPGYANTSKTITVEVDGINQRQDVDWTLNPGSPQSIEFLSNNGLKVFDQQKVKISFFVDLSVHKVMDSKLAALKNIQTICHCATIDCGLRPIKNTAGEISDYACIYPDPNPVTPPISQKIYLSSKTVPVRYFDSTGTSRASVNGDTLAQEGKAFSYRKGDLLNPNNVTDINNPTNGEDTYIGFNEIYGSLSYTNNSAKPAKEVNVSKGKIYDIYVDNGTYSNCVQCGNDYYSQLNKLFPLTQFAGGLIPLQARTDRYQANGVRADDLKFGRACMLPATMIPWSHAVASDPQEQRLNRLRTQHFYYSNGYQYDWFGFDYGAVIGSFDGVKWFSIGTNRRIKADSNKLFIAVNGPFGDLALESTFTVTVNDGAMNPAGSNMITSDLESDGAECQKFHQCSTDNDCATTLGWEYVCTNVNEITTSWPRFDDNAKEIPDSARDDNRLVNILGISTTGKRCVYRGRGSACTQNYQASAINLNSTFNQTQNQSLHTCSLNNYCQSISSNSTLNSAFNNRIARFGKVRTDSNSDSFGLATKVAGRPMEFNASETLRSETARNINANKVAGLCVPGRSPEIDNFISQNSTVPPSEYLGDRVLGMGMSYRSNTVGAVKTYLASCPVFNSTNNYYYTSSSTPAGSNSANTELITNSSAQDISTNAMTVFNSIFNSKGLSFGLLKKPTTTLTSISFEENRCMRAPGASCFSDNDCAPSKIIADRIKMISAEDTSITNTFLNKYEIKFWQEELICSQATSKSDAAYSTYSNRCCRDVGKTISIPIYDISNGIYMDKIAGVDISMSNPFRYSRVSTVYKDQKNDPTNYPVLQGPIKDQCALTACPDPSVTTNQFKTFSAYAERTSCSGDWVRNFTSGNHVWDKTKFQSFNASMFKCMNWYPGKNGWSCKGLEKDDPNCLVVQTSPYSGKAKAVMSYMARLELTGIPQIALESEDFFNGVSEGDMSCRSFPTDQGACYPGNSDPACNNRTAGVQSSSLTNYAYPIQLFTTGASAEYKNGSGQKYYSALDANNFQSMKTIFKSDEVVACIPAGTTMTVGADPNLCCTGFINAKTNKCQLPDFVDVSVYTNRYVSSEGRKLSPNLFDQNGYIKDPSYVAQLACEKRMCASGVLAYGILISKLRTPGQEKIDQKIFRFLENNPDTDDLNGLLSLYNAGLKLNNHAYCLPASSNSSGQSNDDLTIISCGN